MNCHFQYKLSGGQVAYSNEVILRVRSANHRTMNEKEDHSPSNEPSNSNEVRRFDSRNEIHGTTLIHQSRLYNVQVDLQQHQDP
jgi:hypothetical protein